VGGGILPPKKRLNPPSLRNDVTAIDFSQVVDEHYQALYRFALSLARDSHTAADLTQQAFYVFAEKGHQIREKSKAKSWLFTTLHREFLKQRRRGARMTVVEDTEPLMEPPQFAEANENARKLDGAAIVDALNELDELYRAPLTLFYLQQTSYKEIAEILDVPIGTVMSRLSRGKDQLRKIIAAADAPPKGRVVPFRSESIAKPQSQTSSSS
jgi:RNA polymerase sigma-70 factor (ECF subfamily)